MATYTELLASVKTAIQDILSNGQSLGDDGSTLTRADLGTLHALQKDYQIKANREASTKTGRSRVRYVVPQ